MYLYDHALEEIKDGWDAERNKDGWSSLSATPRLNNDGHYSYNTKEDGYKIRICHKGTTWLEHNAFLSFEGNKNWMVPIKQVAVMFDADYLLRTEFANVRYMIVCTYAALPLAVDPDHTSAEDALELVEELFSRASGGKDIYSHTTKSLSNRSVSCTQNGVTYTLTSSGGILYLYATIGTKPVI